MKNNTVVLIDDHELVRAGIRTLLNSIDGIEVIGESGEGLDAIPLLKKLKPNLVILDISLKGLNGMEIVKVIHEYKLPTKILMLSMHNNVEYVAKCLWNGAQGYLLKDAAVEELEPAIKSVLSNRRYIGKDIDQTLLAQLMSNAKQPTSVLELLTGRQRQILQLIAEGHSTRDIADKINVSIKTVETHRSHIMSRLKIYDVAGLVKIAMKEHLTW